MFGRKTTKGNLSTFVQEAAGEIARMSMVAAVMITLMLKIPDRTHEMPLDQVGGV